MNSQWYACIALTAAALTFGLTVGTAPPAGADQKNTQLPPRVNLPSYQNRDFYQDGKFQLEKARDAYFGLMAAHGYPVPESLRTNMWATDFGLGDFVNVGMGGIFWINDEKHGYFAHEIYLLPGQMIVEHAHEGTAKGQAKFESWHVRHGSIRTFGEEGEPLPAGMTLPASQEKFITVRKSYEMLPGDIRSLNRATAKHFMRGGAQGAIVSEYATFHDGDGLRFTNPGVRF